MLFINRPLFISISNVSPIVIKFVLEKRKTVYLNNIDRQPVPIVDNSLGKKV